MVQGHSDGKVVLLSPVAERAARSESLAPRLPTLSGATVAVINALIDQQRSNGQLFSSHVGEMILRHGAHEILDIRKEVTERDLPGETVSHIASQSQGAIILQGD